MKCAWGHSLALRLVGKEQPASIALTSLTLQNRVVAWKLVLGTVPGPQCFWTLPRNRAGESWLAPAHVPKTVPRISPWGGWGALRAPQYCQTSWCWVNSSLYYGQEKSPSEWEQLHPFMLLVRSTRTCKTCTLPWKPCWQESQPLCCGWAHTSSAVQMCLSVPNYWRYLIFLFFNIVFLMTFVGF